MPRIAVSRKFLGAWVGVVLAGCSLNAATPPATPEASADLQDCDQLITTAIQTVGAVCNQLQRNQACYGNKIVRVDFRPNVSAEFSQSGDIIDLDTIQRISTAPLDPGADDWGIAVIKAQANIEDTAPGQNVTFLLFGDTQLDNPTPDMRAVTLRTGVGRITCEGAPPAAVMVQSPEGRQVTMNINGAEVSLASTIFIRAVANQEMTVATVEGQGVVTAFGTTQTIQPGAQVRMPLGGTEGIQVAGPPSPPEPLDVVQVEHAPLPLLERPVQLPSPIPPQPTSSGATLIPTVRPTSTRPPTSVPPTQLQRGQATPTVCVVRGDWTATYVVASGDTLSRVAQRFGVTLTELQTGNCIGNADQITVGQILRVPFSLPTITPIPQPTTSAAVSAALRADTTSVELGKCATLSWDVVNASQVFFEGQPASASASRQVCPQKTTTYTLLVIDANNTQSPYTITIDVTQPAAVCGNQVCEAGEDPRSCQADCSAVCGNQVCEAGEDEKSCPDDCAGR